MSPRKVWTPEERKAASDRAKQRWHQRQESPPPAPTELDTDDDDVLGQLMATLQQAKAKKVKGTQLLEQLGSLLDQIDPKDHPELADDPTIQTFLEKIGEARLKKAEKDGLPPGSYVGTGLAQQDVQWKLADVNRRPDGSKELVTWTPAETILIGYNGVFCQAVADVEMTTEKAFKDLYDEHRRATREAQEHKAYMFGRSDYLPPSYRSGDAAVATAKVRAFMSMGEEKGGGRIGIGYPGDAKFELREVPGSGDAAAQ